MRFCAIILLTLLGFLPCGRGYGAPSTAACDLPPMPVDQRPDPDGIATPVKIGVLVADVTSVDDVRQTVEGDFILKMRWRDPRLANFAGCKFTRTLVWFPNVELLNSSQLQRQRVYNADQVVVENDGEVSYVNRFFGTISTYHQLQRFPFDKQVFQLRMADFDYSSRDLQLVANKNFTRAANLLNIPDLTVDSVNGQAHDIDIKEFGEKFSVFVIQLAMSRNSSYYVYKIIVPLSLIVMMSWVPFWIDPDRFGPQIGLSATSMLTLIAFQFAQSAVLPRLSYFTLMDKLLLSSTLIVFLSLTITALTAYFVTTGKRDTALRMGAVCRWLFPLIFIVIWFLIITSPFENFGGGNRST